MKTYNYMKGWAPELALKTRPKVIRKWPIGWTYSDKLLTIKHNTTSSRKDIQVNKIRRGTAGQESRKQETCRDSLTPNNFGNQIQILTERLKYLKQIPEH